MASNDFALLRKSSSDKESRLETSMNYLQIFWCDLNINNNENQYYINGLKEFGFIKV